MRARHSDPLEAWGDESIERARARGYHPNIFIGMRERYTTVPAMEKIVASGEIKEVSSAAEALGNA